VWRVLGPGLVVLAGCRDILGIGPLPALDATGADDDAAIDAVSPDDALDAALGAWGTPAALVELNSTAGDDDDDASLTDDMLEIYFSSTRAGGQGMQDLWVATRTAIGVPWSVPTPVVELNSAADDTTAVIAGDGMSIHFGSTRGATFSDLYVSTRAMRGDPWTTPAKVLELSSPGLSEYGGHVTDAGRRIVFCRAVAPVDTDILVADRASAGDLWNAPTTMTELQTGAGECECMEPDRRTIYLASDRNGNYDLFVATKQIASDVYDTPQPIVELNSVAADGDPWVAPDHRTIYFTSERGPNGDADLYIATR
jgi:hypothetical protein